MARNSTATAPPPPGPVRPSACPGPAGPPPNSVAPRARPSTGDRKSSMEGAPKSVPDFGRCARNAGSSENNTLLLRPSANDDAFGLLLIVTRDLPLRSRFRVQLCDVRHGRGVVWPSGPASLERRGPSRTPGPRWALRPHASPPRPLPSPGATPVCGPGRSGCLA